MKSRAMTKDGITVNVTRHLILRNFWEIYITDRPSSDPDIAEAVVYGYETELGDVYLPEYKPHTISDTDKQPGALRDIAPAPGWSWV